MKVSKVSFDCGSDSIDFFTNILVALRDCTKTVKVRVGGYEGSIDSKSIESITTLVTNDLVTARFGKNSIYFYAKPSALVFLGEFLKKFENHSQGTSSQSFTMVRIGGKEFYTGCDHYIENLFFDKTSDSSLTNSVKDIVIENILIDNTRASSLTNSVKDIDDIDDNDGDSDEVIAVKEVISDKISKDIMFTAFDITKELRKNGNKVRHGNIRSIVHDLFRNGEINGYTRTIIDINGERPFVYHPISSDASLYLI